MTVFKKQVDKELMRLLVVCWSQDGEFCAREGEDVTKPLP
jgi:hypothetical protein